jgi:hypothetical protein
MLPLFSYSAKLNVISFGSVVFHCSFLALFHLMELVIILWLPNLCVYFVLPVDEYEATRSILFQNI